MNELLVYSLKSGILLTLLYLPYVLMLRRERFFRLNRMALLGMVLMSVVLPLCRVSYSVNADETVTSIVETQDLAFRAEAMIVEANRWDVWQWLSLLYIIGVAVALCYRVYLLLLVRRFIVRGSLWQQRKADGTTIYCHAAGEVPFSWMHSIVISQQDYEQNAREVLLHEQAHICCGHSFDILLLTVVKVLQWWNPWCTCSKRACATYMSMRPTTMCCGKAYRCRPIRPCWSERPCRVRRWPLPTTSTVAV